MKTSMSHSSNSPTLAVMRREFGRIAERKAVYTLMIIVPLIVFFLVSYIYRDRVVVDIPVGVCDLDNSQLSRTVVRAVESTRSMAISGRVSSVEDIKNEMRKGVIQGAFYIPEDFERDVKSGKPATIVVYKNTANLIIGNLILKDAGTISQTVSVGVLKNKLQASGLSPDQALVRANPITIDSHSLFNPGYNYAIFLPPAIIMVLLQMLVMILAVVVINGEINDGTLADLFQTANGKVSAVLLGKTLAHVAIHSTTGLGVLVMLFPLFGIPIRGSMLLAIPFMVYFIAASFLPGLVISCMFTNKFTATDIAAFYNSPAFLFSGYTFPIWAMPALHRCYAQVLPFTHFLSSFLKIYQYNAPLTALLPDIGALSVFIVGSLVAAVALLKYRVKQMAISPSGRPEVIS